MIRTFLLTLLVVLSFWACKNDPPTLVSPDMNDLEKAYFEDYDVPEDKWGYIDISGKMKIKNIYDDCRDFMDGIALTSINGKWGYIDTKGKTIIDHQFIEAGSFINGLALVKDFEGARYFINKKGEKALEVEGDKLKEFDHGLSVFVSKGFAGAYDTKGSVSIPADYEKLKVLNDQHVLAKRGKKYMLLDHKGSKINDLVFDKLYFEGSFPYVIKEEGKYFVLNDQFEKLDKAFDKLEAFKSKYNLAKNGDVYQLIDIRAKQIKELIYERVEYAGEGRWKYKKEGKWGLLDEEGNLMTEATFYLLNRYKEGFIVYGENEDKWGYLDASGNIATKAAYPLVWDYHNGHARFISMYGFGFIGKNSEISVAPRYFELRDFNDGLARAQLFR